MRNEMTQLLVFLFFVTELRKRKYRIASGMNSKRKRHLARQIEVVNTKSLV